VRRLQERRPVVTALSDRDDTASRQAAAGASGQRRVVTTLLTAAVVVGLDQVTKSLALADLHGAVHVIGPFGFALRFNSGAAFSLFTGATGAIVVIAVVFVAVLGWMAWRTRTALMAVALGLILGGALGNLGDRLFRGHGGAVVDFVTLSHFPTFNVADASITFGAIGVVALMVFGPARAS
jgi:signal peptidase II